MAENGLLEPGHLWNAKGYLIPGRTAALAAATIGVANAVCAALRNISNEELVVDSIEQGFMTTTAATAGFVSVGFAVYKVTGFTVLPATGGRTAAPAPPVPVRKRTTDHALIDPVTDFSVQIAQTAALTGGTFVAPEFNDPIAQFIADCDLATTAVYNGQVKHEPKNNIPWSLAANEGLIFVNQFAWPTGLVGVYSLGIDVHRA